ncbi:MAG: hypothetical protein NT072_11100 [Deltaproteobacteria bacterium]|nr:hypothetical protein [Deltaproteobacteria bacterium]
MKSRRFPRSMAATMASRAGDGSAPNNWYASSGVSRNSKAMTGVIIPSTFDAVFDGKTMSSTMLITMTAAPRYPVVRKFLGMDASLLAGGRYLPRPGHPVVRMEFKRAGMLP